jgi:hypothetical protein
MKKASGFLPLPQQCNSVFNILFTSSPLVMCFTMKGSENKQRKKGKRKKGKRRGG